MCLVSGMCTGPSAASGFTRLFQCIIAASGVRCRESTLSTHTAAAALTPAPRSSTKFLPGAVQTPAPAPTKAALGGKPASNGASLGRTFSWQPIKFPVYK